MTPTDDGADEARAPSSTADPERADAGGDDAGGDDAPETAGPDGVPRKRRRRRRRRHEGAAGDQAGEPGGERDPASAPPAAAPAPGGDPPRAERGPRDEADRARREADRRRSEADRARREADRRRNEAGAPRPRGDGGPPRPRGDAGPPARPDGSSQPRGDAAPSASPGSPGGDAGRRTRGRRGDRGRDDAAARGRDDAAGRGRDDAAARGRDDAAGRGRNARPGREQRGDDARGGPAAREHRPRDGGADARPRPGEPATSHGDTEVTLERHSILTPTFEGPTTRLDPRRPVAAVDELELEGPATPTIPWGKDDDGPPAEVALTADLPIDAAPGDPDPVSAPLAELPSAALGDDVASVTGVRFVPGGRVQWFDAGDADYRHGERVMVDAERGARLAWIAVPPTRRTVRDRSLRRVIRRAAENDLRGEREGDAERAHALRTAKDKAAALRLPLKVFRVEVLGALGRGARLNVYYTTDERLDLRDFLRELGGALGGARIELRQLGVRDEAKAVGGIGSCGLTLCCTTWLPDFVPVSIKMAKDQGLVLSPTKVSGQCGRLKCCLVYEQAGYAELRKGLPKLGKRVIGARGEGRVVEVDVLRQRIRVSYGPGDTEVVAATEVKPLFPSGNQPAARAAGPTEPDDAAEPDDIADPDPGDSVKLPADLARLADRTPTGVADRTPTGVADRTPTGVTPDDDPPDLPDDDPSSAP